MNVEVLEVVRTKSDEMPACPEVWLRFHGDAALRDVELDFLGFSSEDVALHRDDVAVGLRLLRDRGKRLLLPISFDPQRQLQCHGGRIVGSHVRERGVGAR